MSEATKKAIETAIFNHDLENILDEVIDMLPDDEAEANAALYHFVESYNLRFGTGFQVVPIVHWFKIDRAIYYINQLKEHRIL